jgi:hypothetical protein
LQKRLLGPGIRDGLLDVEGDDWRVQRRTLAPLFTPRTVASFARAMNAAAEDLVARWMRLREGRVVDIQPEMARVTLDVLGQSFRTGSGKTMTSSWPRSQAISQRLAGSILSIFSISPIGCRD